MGLSRARLWSLLGLPAGEVSDAHQTARERGVETWVLRIGACDVPATLIRPKGTGPVPAVLYCHSHGNRWEIGRSELLSGRPALPSGAYGPALADLGIASLSIDLPGHGSRIAEGSEGSLSKSALWQGHTLMGQMLSELAAAFEWLAQDPRIDAARIATLGLSMGATHAYWLAALQPKVAATAHLCAFSNIAQLIASGAHDLHGAYMTVPGLLAQGDMGDVAALVAPRPMLICSGSDDPLTPPEALLPALATLSEAYAGRPGALEISLAQDSGHVETATHRAAVLEFLTRTLKPEANPTPEPQQ